MWEFCVNLSDKNINIAKKFYTKLKDICKDFNGIVTTYERCGKISILISAEKCDESRIKHFLKNEISSIICQDFKLLFLEENLSLPNLDKISKDAFLQALLSFDEESDKYYIQNCLELDNSIDIEAFYYFKLQSLKDKWKELVQIANDNKTYLSSNETLIELLKFLVDNLEIKTEIVNILKENDRICLYDNNFKILKQNNATEKDIDSTIISNLISFSPKLVNIYNKTCFNENLINLLKQIFDSRINFVNMEDSLDK